MHLISDEYCSYIAKYHYCKSRFCKVIEELAKRFTARLIPFPAFFMRFCLFCTFSHSASFLFFNCHSILMTPTTMDSVLISDFGSVKSG